jgi:hypothetical protein
MIWSSFLTEWILPFLLIFVIIFALLEKSNLFGEGKQQIDSLVSLSAAILSVSVPYSRQVIVELMPWLGVGLVCLFVFFVMYSFIVGDKLFEEAKWLKYTLLAIVAIFVFGVIFQVTGFWTFVTSKTDSFSSDMFISILLVVIAIVSVGWVVKDKSAGDK